MKFGLIFCKTTDNIGDDIQSYAASRFLPQIDYFIDREMLDSFAGAKDNQKVAVIMNAWYMYTKINWPPSPYIYPLFISIHIAQNDYYGIGYQFLQDIGGEYLKEYAPIGARDSSTCNALLHNEIPAYISGCLTLTLDRFEDAEIHNRVFLVDIEECDAREIMKMYPDELYEPVTHNIHYAGEEIEYTERLRNVERLLRRYQGAKCVITSRLHCALPCLALGVPVLLVYKEEYADRMRDFLPLLHVTTAEEIKEHKMGFNVHEPEKNKDDYVIIRDALKKKCLEFVDAAKERKLICEEIDAYEVLKWQKTLLNRSEADFREKIMELCKWSQQQTQTIEYLENQYIAIKKEYENLKDWCGELQKGKDWLEEQYHRLSQQADGKYAGGEHGI